MLSDIKRLTYTLTFINIVMGSRIIPQMFCFSKYLNTQQYVAQTKCCHTHCGMRKKTSGPVSEAQGLGNNYFPEVSGYILLFD